jgi:NAD(P)H-hydrate repair Nnr-like enzyme with NAD(P)H-hydrate dehydratase domain
VQAVVNATDADHVVLDAGALEAANDLELGARLLIAPNVAEAARLLDRDGDETSLAPMLAEALGRPVAVRGKTTVIAQAQTWLFDDSPPGLGTPGSGDVFIGLLAGLLACGAQDLEALAWSVAIHARAGALLSADAGIGYLATEIAREIPRARVELRDTFS